MNTEGVHPSGESRGGGQAPALRNGSDDVDRAAGLEALRIDERVRRARETGDLDVGLDLVGTDQVVHFRLQSLWARARQHTRARLRRDVAQARARARRAKAVDRVPRPLTNVVQAQIDDVLLDREPRLLQ